MTPKQRAYLESVVAKIPKLFEMIDAGNDRAVFNIGHRTIAGKRVRLRLVAEVIDDDSTNNRATYGLVASAKQ